MPSAYIDRISTSSSSSILVIALLACRASPDPSATAGSAKRDAAIMLDASARDAAADAPLAVCPVDDPGTHAFRFGTLQAPHGWCWRRTAEGDDQSGVLYDDAGRVRLRYYELSFDEKVDDACGAHRPGVHGVREVTANGVAFRACELDDGRHCVSVRGLANLCTEPPEADFSLVDLIHSVHAKRK